MMYLGDILPGQTIDFMWNSAGANGASITRATNGTISVYKGNNTTQTTTGVTDTEDFDSLTGVHHCRIATTDSFYVPRENYMVVLSAATIDGQTVNAVIAHFSILNRFPGRLAVWAPVNTGVTAASTTAFSSDQVTEATADHFNGRQAYFYGGALADQSAVVEDYAAVGGEGRFTISTVTDTAADGDNAVII
jgi:hypothetical protein